MSIPEGRKPMSDADLAALTRRLADTAIERNCRCDELEAERDALKAELQAAMNALNEVWRVCLVDANQARIDAEAERDALNERKDA